MNCQRKKVGDVIYRVGDRVMQIKNNYDITWEREAHPFGIEKLDGNVSEKDNSWASMYLAKPKDKKEIGTGVFNGEIGTIIEIDEREKVVKIQFDDEKIAWYEYSDLDQIEHSYAITIHKAQR